MAYCEEVSLGVIGKPALNVLASIPAYKLSFELQQMQNFTF
jgi:hypothetical protein